MNTIIKLGLAALVAGAFSTLPSKAETPDIFTGHGLPIPGAYFKKKASQQPTAIVVRKSEKNGLSVAADLLEQALGLTHNPI